MPQQLRAYLIDRNEEIREDVVWFSGPRYRGNSDQSLHGPQQLAHIHMCSRFSKIIPTRLLEHSLIAKGQGYSPNKEHGAPLVGGPPPPATNRGCLLLPPPPARTSPPLFGCGVYVVAGQQPAQSDLNSRFQTQQVGQQTGYQQAYNEIRSMGMGK